LKNREAIIEKNKKLK